MNSTVRSFDAAASPYRSIDSKSRAIAGEHRVCYPPWILLRDSVIRFPLAPFTRVFRTMTEVREFITRLEQGYTEAFLCRSEDGRAYVCKSVRAGREALIKEVICSRVGSSLGLPIPPVEILYASPSVAERSLNSEITDLATEPGFGSCFVDSAATLNVADLTSVDAETRRLVLLFDWWIFNEDRTDDNPNLLWQPASHQLHVIDHNLAFGTATDVENVVSFWNQHLFRSSRPGMTDRSFRNVIRPMMDRVMADLGNWWDALPYEWTSVCRPMLSLLISTLSRYLSEEFWT